MAESDKETIHEAGARERLLSAALTLFNRKGYASASVREIVQSAGVTKPVLYYYFRSKEGIYHELMESSYRTFESLIANIASREGTTQQRIADFCSALFDASVERLSLVRLIYAIYYGPPQGAPHYDLEAYFVRMMEVVKKLVRAGVGSGELKDNNVEDVSRSIISLLTSAINEQLSRREGKLDREGMLRTLRLLMSGISS